MECKVGLHLSKTFRDRRAPGGTCLSALASPEVGSVVRPINNSKGCGGIMRVAPIGLSGIHAFDWAVDAAALTHGHPGGYLPAGVFSDLIGELLSGYSIIGAITRSIQVLRQYKGHEETMEAINRALALADEAGAPSPARVESLGGGWTGEEALAIGLYAALTARSYEDGVLVAINHSGDSDSTGLVAGALLGAIYGRWQIPDRWVSRLEAAQIIRDYAFKLYLRDREAGICN